MLTNTKSYRCIAASLAVLVAGSVYGQEIPQPPASLPPASQPALFSQPISQTLYKGVIGTLLEDVPLEPEKRVTIQRGSSVVSGTLSGRSLAVMLGVTNPVLLAAGLAWGLFAASRITPARAQTAPSNPLPGAVGVTADPAVVGADGTIVRKSDMLLCVDSDLEATSAAARAPDYTAALSD